MKQHISVSMPPSLWGSTAESSSHKYSCLAQADPLKLPTKVHKAGTGALRSLTTTVLRAWSCKIMICPSSKISPASLEWIRDYFLRLRSYISTSSGIPLPLSLPVASTWERTLFSSLCLLPGHSSLQTTIKLSCFPIPGPSRDADIRKAICHCFFLNVLTKAFVIAPIGNDTPIHHLFQRIDEEKSYAMKRLIARNIVPSRFGKEARDHTAFTLIKIISVDLVMMANDNCPKLEVSYFY